MRLHLYPTFADLRLDDLRPTFLDWRTTGPRWLEDPEFAYCMKAGIPVPVINALLALIDDTYLLAETFVVWQRERVANDFAAVVHRLTNDDCLFCGECSEPIWLDDATEVNRLGTVCEVCRDYNATMCCQCDEYYTDTTTVSDEYEYCEGCFDANCYYCDNCDEYYRAGYGEHDHKDEDACCCEAPLPNFEFPADGHGVVSQDERLTVELPKGTIDHAGMARIKGLLFGNLNQLDPTSKIVDEVGPLWQTKRGNFTRRLSSAFYKHGIKLDPAVVSEVGNVARAHSSEGATWHVEFTRDLNQPAEFFYHDESCWWLTYYASRCALKNWGGVGLRTFSEDASYPNGRAWVQPLRRTGDGLVPAHDTVGADAYVVFNGYGDLSGYVAARIVAHLCGRTYRKIVLSADRQFINSDTGYLVADEATCEGTDRLYFDYDEHDQQDAHVRIYGPQEEAA